MTDIVERLRRQVSESPYDEFVSPLEAAAEIERLRADNERLRGVEQDAAEWVKERTKRLRADNERLRAALLKIANLEYGCVDDACEAPITAVAALEGKDG